MTPVMQESTDPFTLVKSLYRKIDCHLCDTITATRFYHLSVSKECRKDTADKNLIRTRDERAHGFVNNISRAPRVHLVFLKVKNVFIGMTPHINGSSALFLCRLRGISGCIILIQLTQRYDSILMGVNDSWTRCQARFTSHHPSRFSILLFQCIHQIV